MDVAVVVVKVPQAGMELALGPEMAEQVSPLLSQVLPYVTQAVAAAALSQDQAAQLLAAEAQGELEAVAALTQRLTVAQAVAVAAEVEIHLEAMVRMVL